MSDTPDTNIPFRGKPAVVPIPPVVPVEVGYHPHGKHPLMEAQLAMRQQAVSTELVGAPSPQRKIEDLEAENAHLHERLQQAEEDRDRLAADYLCGDLAAQANAWSGVWRELERQGILSFVAQGKTGHQRAVEFVRHMGEERARLRTDLLGMGERLKDCSDCLGRVAARNGIADTVEEVCRRGEQVRRLEQENARLRWRVTELEQAMQLAGDVAGDTALSEAGRCLRVVILSQDVLQEKGGG